MDYSTTRTLPGPEDIHRQVLDNGIVLLSRTHPQSPSAVFSGYLPAGSMFDSPELLGLAHFTALSLMRGTAQRSFEKLFDELETAGASLGFGASVHNVNFGARSLAEDLPLTLSMLSEVLSEPIFPSEQIERLRGQILSSLAIRAQDTEEVSSLRFDELLFKGHPYANPEDGFPETIRRITRDNIVDFHRVHYSPTGMVLVVVSPFPADRVADMVKSTLEPWSNPISPQGVQFPVVIPPVQPIREHIFLDGKTQVDVVLGGLGPKRNDPQFLAASLGNNILGNFGMMGRIGEAVREKAGLAYYAATSLNAWISAGSWEINLGVNPANVSRAIDLVLGEIKRFTSEPVTEEELRDSQMNYIGRLPLSFESNNGVASGLLNIERFQLGLDYYQRYPQRINVVKTGEVLEIAKHYLNPEHFITISAGSQIP